MATDKMTVKMKFVGQFKGTTKKVELPIPLISNSQKLEETLKFTRTDKKQGPAFCDVPLDWVGALLAVGGNWRTVDPITPELALAIAEAKAATDARMAKLALENELVEA